MAESVNIQFNVLGKDLDNFLNDLKVQFKDINVSVNKVDNSANSTFTNINNQLKTISFVNLTQGLENLRNTLRDINGPGIEFNQTVADLGAITGIAGADLDDLATTARKVGKESGLGANQATEAFKLLASQISVDKMGIDGLKTLQKETIALAQASGMDLPTAANSMASAINQFGLEATDASRVINVLAAGSKYGAAEIPELAQTFKVAGAAANAAGLDIEGLAGAAEVLSKNAVTGSEAGTQLRNIILRMQTNLGVDFKQTSLSEALDSLKPKLNDTQWLVKQFGMESVASVQFLVGNAQAVEEMTGKVTETNVAYEQAEIRNSTLQHSLNKTKAWFDDLKIGVTELTGSMLPYLETFFGVAQGMSTLMPLITGLRQAYQWLRIAKNRDTIATMLNNTWTKISIVSTGLFSAATYGLGAAFRFMTGPIGLIITGLALVTAGVMYAWNNFEGFRVAILGIWEAVKTVFSNVAKFLGKMLKPFIDAIKFVMDGEWGKAFFAVGKGLANAVTMPIQFGMAVVNGEITEGVAEAQEKGEAKGRASWAKDQAEKAAKKKQEDELAAVLSGNSQGASTVPQVPKIPITPSTDTQTSANKATRSGDSIAGAARHINTRIENLVGTVNVYVEGGANEIRGKIRQVLNEELTGAVRDFEVAVG